MGFFKPGWTNSDKTKALKGMAHIWHEDKLKMIIDKASNEDVRKYADNRRNGILCFTDLVRDFCNHDFVMPYHDENKVNTSADDWVKCVNGRVPDLEKGKVAICIFVSGEPNTMQKYAELTSYGNNPSLGGRPTYIDKKLSYSLPDEIKAQNPENAEFIIYMLSNPTQTGHYSGAGGREYAGAAFLKRVIMYTYQRPQKKQIYHMCIYGSHPPEQISGSYGASGDFLSCDHIMKIFCNQLSAISKNISH